MKVFVGYDPRQPIAFQTLVHSIWSKASKPVEIVRLQLDQLPITRRGLTEFTYSRFLVPYLSGYQGMSVFIDSDFVCLDDITKLEPIAQDSFRPTTPTNSPTHDAHFPEYNLSVCKNKLRFEWASMMVFNNPQCKMLTPSYVDSPANSLFDMAWATYGVGELPKEWNQLVGYDKHNTQAKLVHYTQGIPIWPETKDSEYKEEWMEVARHANSSVSFKDLMGNSVHAKPVYDRLNASKNK